ncbi:MAG: AAA family ATPase, partial [Longimicrobiales bacterium]|nr:AAA family ATPase [Longimicrobiales bacterium]
MSSEHDGYRVQLFAEPLLRTPDGGCHLSPFQSALVTLVYAHETIARRAVAELLWGDDEVESRTRQRIRQLKNAIGRRTSVQLIEAEGDHLLASPDIASDFRDVARQLDEGSLAEAARTLSRGLSCPEIGGASSAFDVWAEDFCEQLRARVAALATARWQLTQDGNDWPAARDAAEALYVFWPGDPESVARVIEARARVGQIQAAEVAYAEFCLARNGSQPSPVVDEAIGRVRQLSEAPRSPRLAARVPFVGRKTALADLTTIFDDVRSGVFTFALVAGEAGIGKTRLIREVERSARLEGFRCISAEPVELERRIPMNPIIDALGAIELEPHLQAIGEPWRTVIGTMLPPGPLAESVQALPPIEEKSLSRRLLDAFSLLFRSISEERPTIFFLDDLQWADATTIAALQFYQRRWKESFFGVVATVRPRVVGKKDAAHAYLEEGGKLSVRRIDLEELSAKEARKLVELLGEEQMDSSDVSKLCALSGRHPLYLTELTRDFLSGRLALPESEADAFTIPISLKQILASRTNGLDEAGRAVLNTLAVGSKPMRLGDLSEILELPLDKTADAAGELSQR